MDIDSLADGEQSDMSMRDRSYSVTSTQSRENCKIQELLKSLVIQRAIIIECRLLGSSELILFFDIPNCRILELPTDNDEKLLDAAEQAALQEYLSQHLPVPRVVAFDCTEDNPLESQYLIQENLQGLPLSDKIGSFSFKERIDFIPELVKILLEMESVEFTESGRITAADNVPGASASHSPGSIFTSIAPSLDDIVEVGPFLKGDGEDLRSINQYDSLKSLLKIQLQSWYISERPDEPVSHDIPEKVLYGITKKMSAMGFFEKQQPHVLWHRDLDARNLLVDKINGAWTITGIVGWRNALSVPRVLARQPPEWFWTFDYTHGRPPPKHGYRYNSPEEQAVQNIFEYHMEQASPGWKEDAYWSGELIRRVARFALNNFQSEDDWEEYHWLLRDWEAYVRHRENEAWATGDLSSLYSHASSPDKNGSSLDRIIPPIFGTPEAPDDDEDFED